jgi:hypothetical protein
LIAAFAFGACGSSNLTAKSSCSDYVKASPADKDTAVSKIAQDLNAPKAAGLGRPNIDNACVQSPSTTLGTVISRYRPADEAPNASSSETGVQAIDDTAAYALLRGFQLDSAGLASGTARDLITAKVAQLSEQAHILPDGVTLEAFSRLLDKALITVVPPGDYGEASNKPFCNGRTLSPTEVINNSSWVVTFPAEGDSKADTLRKNTAKHCF